MAKWLSKEEKRVKTYRFENNWLVDIIKTEDKKTSEPLYDVWLYRDDYGVKDYMFGLYLKDLNGLEELLDIIESQIDDYKKIYWDLHIQEDEPEDFM